MRAGRMLAWAALASLPAVATAAQVPHPLPDRELLVGVFEAPPYAMKGPSGEWRGFTVEIWKEIASDLGLKYRLEEKTEAQILEGLSGGRLDLAVGPFASTEERQRVIDFSHTYLNTGLAVAVRPRSRYDRLWNLFRTLATSESAHIILAIAILSILFGGAIWLAERRRNPQFPARPAPGIGAGIWWAGVTTTGVGYGDKVPITLAGRLLAIAWMLVSLILYVVLTAGLAATLAVAEFQQSSGTESLRHRVVGALDSSAPADFLRRNQVPVRLYPSFEAAVGALKQRKIDAVMFGEAILRYYAARDEGKNLAILPQIFMSEDLAFPLPDGSPLRDPLNLALRRTLAGPRYRDLKDRYLGDLGGRN
ncbi:MAG: transporter substrate-binding domain-containing protein [Acidobacteriota bacterium]